MNQRFENRVALLIGSASGMICPTAGAFAQALNTTAFTNRIGLTSDVGPYRFGTGGTNVVIGPSIVELDSSLQRSLSVTERSYPDFGAESSNLPDHPIFSEPGLTVGTPTHSVISSTSLSSRQIQSALKLIF